MAAIDAHEPMVSTRTLTRLIIILIALWSLLEGIVLVGFHGASSGALGAGVTDEAGQRLVGAHLLVLAPAYLLIALRSQLYKTLIWLPFAGQLALALTVGYSILTGETDFGDGILSVAVGAIFAGLLAYVWVSQQRSVAQAKLDEDDQAMRQSDDAFTFEEP
ncbi:MAG TPA: hypothetical protein VI759_00930 [Dehalococcoidia bacterium]|nr:hypothetical protein [Dehalococcoidia bacterium]